MGTLAQPHFRDGCTLEELLHLRIWRQSKAPYLEMKLNARLLWKKRPALIRKYNYELIFFPQNNQTTIRRIHTKLHPAYAP